MSSEAKQLLCGLKIWDPQEAHTHTWVHVCKYMCGSWSKSHSLRKRRRIKQTNHVPHKKIKREKHTYIAYICTYAQTIHKMKFEDRQKW